MLALKSDEIRGKKIIALEFYFMGNFKESGESYKIKGAEFLPILSGVTDSDNIFIENIIEDEIGVQTIRSKGWYRIDLAQLDLYIPYEEYFCIGLKPLSNSISIPWFKVKEENPIYFEMKYRFSNQEYYWVISKLENNSKKYDDYIFPFKLILED
ncbi:hypothetical protein BST92_14120 [Nonlabens arenilitoris]|uniref:Uncharacterized protein n=1 Tax=Nonlabens arenilitoris TaxID=1217969 RepID=A0A2S7UEB9_9FLAO|nr:hypothetical protein [Nonlabens arenilitoris]PQJ32987.1 hypothetical protein BST92_14120 [Nonlabens arenilitoris]